MCHGRMWPYCKVRAKYRPLIFTGESYAGKYILYFAARIPEQGLFNLQTLMIGNPYTSPVNQRTST
jgi:carboxypeptidase C (cathepsin A)